jgi:hypothetical protein
MNTPVETPKQVFVLDREHLFFVTITTFQIVVCVILWLVLLRGEHPKPPEQASYLIYFLALAPATFASWLAVSRCPGWRRSGLGKILPWLLVLAGSMTLLLVGKFVNIHRVVYYWFDPVPLRPFPFSAFRAVIGAMFGALLFVALTYLGSRFHQAHRVRHSLGMIAIWVVGIAILLGVFDPQLSLDTLAYSPYVGPAYAVRNGAVPMIDTFSQYGLNYLIFVPAFVWKQSFPMAAAIVSGLGVVMGLAYMSIVTRLSRNWLFVFVGGVFTVLSVQSAFFYNINYTPSVYAMRFLPSVLLVAALVRIPRSSAITVASGAALILCALWSFESLLYAILVYLVWLVVRGLGERRQVRQLLRDFSYVVLLVLLPHAVLTIVYLAAFGTPPRYDIYFQLIFGNFEGSYWYLLVENGVYAWVVFGLVYGCALAIAGYQSLTGVKDARWSAGLAALAALGVLHFYYYVARSTTPALVFLALPMMLLVLLACDWAVDALRARREAGLPILALPALGAGFALFVCMGTVLADRLYDPINQNSSNSMLLRACMLGGEPTLCSIRRMMQLVAGTDIVAGTYPHTQSGGALPENEPAFNLTQRFAIDGSRRVLIFGNDPVPVIFHSPRNVASRIIYPPHALGITYPSVDGLSRTLRTRALASLEGLRAGDILIRGKLPIYELDKQALSLIEGRWLLCSKEKIGTVEAFELVAPGEGECNAR